MQFAVIAGGMFAQKYGSIAPLVIIIALKTLADLVASGSGPAMKGVTDSSGNTTIIH